MEISALSGLPGGASGADALAPAFPEINAGDGVVVVDAGVTPDLEATLARIDASGGMAVVLARARDRRSERFADDPRVAAWLLHPVESGALVATVRLACQSMRLRRRVEQQSAESEHLLRIGLSLSSERNIRRLQELVVRSARELTNADSGSLFLVEDRDEERPSLRFVVAQTGSADSHFVGATLALTRDSICGFVALTGESVRIDDAYAIPKEAPYRFNDEFDQREGYRTTSVLCVPVRNHERAIVGVIQLINRKPRFDIALRSPEHTLRVVQPFDDRDERVLLSLASQAGIALENETLLDSIEELFERFVRASVKAIEVRDRATLGHSERVALLTVAQAEAINTIESGPFANVHFDEAAIREVRYAALLHDFGKVAVPEYIFNKAKKLADGKIDTVRLRFLLAIEQAKDEEERILLRALLHAVEEANEPRVIEGERVIRDLRLESLRYDDCGIARPILESDDIEALTIRRGSLTTAERQQMEAHVQQSYEFLREIPWRRTPWKRVPEFAYGHHEHLDGTGYPRGLRGSEIPPQVRMMTIADVFDALTAYDRPYKAALSIERALDILTGEFAARGKIDPNILDVFISRRLWEAKPTL